MVCAVVPDMAKSPVQAKIRRRRTKSETLLPYQAQEEFVPLGIESNLDTSTRKRCRLRSHENPTPWTFATIYSEICTGHM